MSGKINWKILVFLTTNFLYITYAAFNARQKMMRVTKKHFENCWTKSLRTRSFFLYYHQIRGPSSTVLVLSQLDRLCEARVITDNPLCLYTSRVSPTHCRRLSQIFPSTAYFLLVSLVKCPFLFIVFDSPLRVRTHPVLAAAIRRIRFFILIVVCLNKLSLLIIRWTNYCSNKI